jgi:starch synthase (maltosyl-transferring)
VVNTDPHAVRETTIRLDLSKFGLDQADQIEVQDLITGTKFVWGASNYVRLDSLNEPAHILQILRKK